VTTYKMSVRAFEWQNRPWPGILRYHIALCVMLDGEWRPIKWLSDNTGKRLQDDQLTTTKLTNFIESSKTLVERNGYKFDESDAHINDVFARLREEEEIIDKYFEHLSSPEWRQELQICQEYKNWYDQWARDGFK